MLGKLMKYEFKATSRIFVPLFSALLIISTVSRLMNRLQSVAPQLIGLTVAAMLIAAAFVVTLILTIQRFYKNFMSSEGYLMFTLPVNTDRLIWSKLLVAGVWNIVCVFTVYLSILIMALPNDEFVSIIQSFTQLNLPTADQVFFTIEIIAIVLAMLLDSILSLYACMALSLFFNKHRVAISFAIYVGMVILLQILAVIAFSILANVDFTLSSGLSAFITDHPNSMVHAVFLFTLLAVAAVGAVFFAVTRYMLKNKLNLQ
jgi:hypothetical protein